MVLLRLRSEWSPALSLCMSFMANMSFSLLILHMVLFFFKDFFLCSNFAEDASQKVAVSSHCRWELLVSNWSAYSGSGELHEWCSTNLRNGIWNQSLHNSSWFQHSTSCHIHLEGIDCKLNLIRLLIWVSKHNWKLHCLQKQLVGCFCTCFVGWSRSWTNCHLCSYLVEGD